MISDLYKFSDGWHWNIDYIKLHLDNKHILDKDIIYLNHDDDIYILYHRLLDRTNRQTLLCYADYVRPLQCKSKKLEKLNLCNFCGIYCKNVVEIRICEQDIRVCKECKNIKPSNDKIYINTKYHGGYKHDIECILNLNKYNKYYQALYSIKLQNNNTFSYIINQKWFQFSKDGCCDFCDLKRKFYKSACKECYNFMFNLCYINHLSKYYLLKDILLINISIVIMDLYLALIGFIDITTNDLQPKSAVLPIVSSPINIIDEEIIIENNIEKDIIYENNLDSYLVDENQ